LYNWCAVNDSRNIAPEGWHVPTHKEWKKLERYLGMSKSEADDFRWRGTIEGKKLKSASGWHKEGNGTDEEDFCALPAGIRSPTGSFASKRYGTYFWTSTESDDYHAGIRCLWWNRSTIYAEVGSKRYGHSVRLVKD